MLPSEGYVTTDDGLRLFFRTLGSGPRTVIIPNGMYFVDDFKQLADGRTLVVYDPRNRGRSETVSDRAKLEGGIMNDVADLDAVRRHLKVDKVDLIGHWYVGMLVILYAVTYGDHVNRIVQIGPMPPHAAAQYPPELTNMDATFREVFAKIGQLQKERDPAEDPEAFCRRFWSVLSLIYITNAGDAGRVAAWGRCDQPNERNFMSYWMGHLSPSIDRLRLTPEDLAKVKAPVLTIHGTKDRSAPYGGGKDWAARLPNARLVSVENAGHAPWIEAPDVVFASIGTFLDQSRD